MSDLSDIETVFISQLRQAADQEVSGSTVIPVEIRSETVRIFLSQIIGLVDESAINPIGLFHACSGDES